MRLSCDGQILPCTKAHTVEFHGRPVAKNIELKAYTETISPSKFQEKINSKKQLDTANAPSNMAEYIYDVNQKTLATNVDTKPNKNSDAQSNNTTLSLVDFLRPQSSSPDKQERK